MIALEHGEVTQPAGARAVLGDHRAHRIAQLLEPTVTGEDLEIEHELIAVVVRAEQMTDQSLGRAAQAREVERRDRALGEQERQPDRAVREQPRAPRRSHQAAGRRADRFGMKYVAVPQPQHAQT